MPRIPRTPAGLLEAVMQPKALIAIFIFAIIMAVAVSLISSFFSPPERARLDAAPQTYTIGPVSFSIPNSWALGVQSSSLEKPAVIFAPQQDFNQPPTTITVSIVEVSKTYAEIAGSRRGDEITFEMLQQLVDTWAQRAGRRHYSVEASSYNAGETAGLVPLSVIVTYDDPVDWIPGAPLTRDPVPPQPSASGTQSSGAPLPSASGSPFPGSFETEIPTCFSCESAQPSTSGAPVSTAPASQPPTETPASATPTPPPTPSGTPPDIIGTPVPLPSGPLPTLPPDGETGAIEMAVAAGSGTPAASASASPTTDPTPTPPPPTPVPGVELFQVQMIAIPNTPAFFGQLTATGRHVNALVVTLTYPNTLSDSDRETVLKVFQQLAESIYVGQ